MSDMNAKPKRSRKSINEFAEIVEGRLSASQTLYNELERLKAEIVEGDDTLPSLEQLKQDIRDFESFKNSEIVSDIKAYHEELITNDDAIKKDVEEKLEKLDEKLVKLEERQQEINKFKNDVFGYKETVETDEVDEETGKPKTKINNVAGVKDQLDAILADANTTKDAEIKKLQDLHAKYDKEIAELLPRATSAGLASAYDETSQQYSKKSNRMHYAFVSTVSLLVVTGFLHSFPNSINAINEIPYLNAFVNTDSIKSFINSAPLLHITIPLIWIAIVCQSKAKTYLRLHAEYQHKANLCKTYDGLQRAASDRKNEALEDQLLQSMVTTSADNPSNHLDKVKPKGFLAEVIDSLRTKP